MEENGPVKGTILRDVKTSSNGFKSRKPKTQHFERKENILFWRRGRIN